jgi:hypothetical protein
MGAGMAEHSNQRIHAEPVDFATHEIADAGLAYTEHFSSLHLGEPPYFDQFAELNHQISTQLEVFGVFRRKTQILEDIPGRPANLGSHDSLPPSCLENIGQTLAS